MSSYEEPNSDVTARNRSSWLSPDVKYVDDLRGGVQELVYNALVNSDLSTDRRMKMLPVLSFRARSNNDPIHKHLIEGLVSGLHRFLEENEDGRDLCRNLAAKSILARTGMTDTWHDSQDVFRDKLYTSALQAVEKAIEDQKDTATASEIKRALTSAIEELRQYVDAGETFTFEHVVSLVTNKLEGKVVPRGAFWDACQGIGIPTTDRNVKDKMFIPQPLINTNDVQVTQAAEPQGSLAHQEVVQGLKNRSIILIGGDLVNIDKINVWGGQVNIAEKIGKITYDPGLGISEDKFNDLVKAVKKLSGPDQAILTGHFVAMQEAKTDGEKQTIFGKARSFLKQHGVAVADSLTAACLFELAVRLSQL